jgi:hypothetical protein
MDLICSLAREWEELQKRARVDRLVTVDGIQVIAAPEVVRIPCQGNTYH